MTWHDCNSFAQGFADGLMPQEYELISVWAEKHVNLPKGTSPYPGYLNLDRTPYVIEILDVLSPQDSTRKVVVMKGTQIAGTLTGNILVFYYMHSEPCPIGFYMPTETMCENHSKTNIQPVLDESPTLKGLLKPSSQKNSGNNILTKNFPGGNLVFQGTNSSASMRNKSFRVIIADDVDGMPKVIKGEGTIIGLIENRADAYRRNYKYYINSTPKERSISNITPEFELSDQREYFCPCPHCEEKHFFTNKNKKQFHLAFEKDDDYFRTSEATMKCPSCENLISHDLKGWMIDPANGAEWIALMPNRTTAGFRIPSFLSTMGLTWNDLADEFLAAVRDVKNKGDNNKLKKYVTTRLAETWEDDAVQMDSNQFMERREAYSAEVPYNAMVLTCGIDTQPDRLEATVIGWGSDNQSWTIEHKIFVGDTTLNHVWERLDEYLDTEFTHDTGKKLNIAATFIDSGGHATQKVYIFCNQRVDRWIFAIKGDSEKSAIRKPILNAALKMSDSRKYEGMKFYMIGTNAAKDMITSWMQIEEVGAGYMHFPIKVGFDKEYFEQLGGEKRDLETNKYIKTRPRQEAFDCWVYGYSAFEFLKLQNGGDLDWVAIETNLNEGG